MQTTISILALAAAAQGAVEFLGISDWGDNTAELLANAKSMNDVAKESSINAVLLLGDNFYNRGIGNDDAAGRNPAPQSGDEFDGRFEYTFETVFDGEALMKLPFYAIMGNHDYSGNKSAELAYAANKRGSGRWMLPAYYYTETFGNVQVVFVDIPGLVGNTDVHDPPLGPDDPDYADAQWTWIEKTLAASTAEFLFVAGHYPVFSAASHGPTEALVTRLAPMLEKYGVQLYIGGHDHVLHHLVVNEVNYVVQGAGHMCCYNPTNVDAVPKDSIQFFAAGPGGDSYQKMPFEIQAGFTHTVVTDDAAVVHILVHDATEVWNVTMKPRMVGDLTVATA